jgi:hypothetical protein
MTSTQPKVDFWRFTVGSAKEAALLYFEPIFQIATRFSWRSEDARRQEQYRKWLASQLKQVGRAQEPKEAAYQMKWAWMKQPRESVTEQKLEQVLSLMIEQLWSIQEQAQGRGLTEDMKQATVELQQARAALQSEQMRAVLLARQRTLVQLLNQLTFQVQVLGQLIEVIQEPQRPPEWADIVVKVGQVWNTVGVLRSELEQEQWALDRERVEREQEKARRLQRQE